MWRTTLFTLLTRTYVRKKCPNIIFGCSTSSSSFKRNKKTTYTKQITEKLNKVHLVKESELKPSKHVLCAELTDEDIMKCVTLKGRIISGEGSCWLLKDKSGKIFLTVSESKMLELENCISKFSQKAYVKVTGVVKKNSSKFTVPYLVSLNTATVEVKNGTELLLNMNPKTISKILPVHMNFFFRRSHNLNQINEENIGQNVILCGWITWICDSNKNFFIIEDGEGQILIDCSEKATELAYQLEDMEKDFIILLDGEVVKRPDNEINYNLKSGTIKIRLNHIEALEQIDKEALNEINNLQSDSEDFEENIVNVPNSRAIQPNFNLYTLRSHNCGDINEDLINQRVHLMGWVIFSRMNQFLVLKDKYGTVQLCLPKKLFEELDLRIESVISAEGIVRARPEKQILHNSPSGRVEVYVTSVNVISRARELPFTVKSLKSSKYLLLQNRYLDLRMNSFLRDNLHFRSQVMHRMRNFLIENAGFLEVETPVLYRKSPGGAQEFIVPTREPGRFYSLVQSPQQFKQMLMIGAIDRYFQIARCFRDETSRRDRQPEFTQLDLEMSFCDQEGVLKLVEDLLSFIWPSDLPPLKTPFRRFTYSETMKLYGTDKPDLRLKIKSVDMTDEMLADASFQEHVISTMQDSVSDLVVKGLILPKEMAEEVFKGKGLRNYSDKCHSFSITETSEEELQRIFRCGTQTAKMIRSKIDVKPDNPMFTAFGDNENVEKTLTDILLFSQNKIKDQPSQNNNSFEFAWITEFPLFEINDQNKMKSVHHPFTQPVAEDIALLTESPLKVRGQHYDLVLNGQEIGGGSMRIHDVELQKLILKEILKLDEEPFQHFLKALSFGAPIHGGFAIGIDRLLAILRGISSIDDVIAFPKFHSGHDPLSGAPCDIPDDDKILYHIKSS